MFLLTGVSHVLCFGRDEQYCLALVTAKRAPRRIEVQSHTVDGMLLLLLLMLFGRITLQSG